MILVDQEEIIEIASDLPRGIHIRVDIEIVALRESRKTVRKHIVLDPRGKIQLGADALFLRGNRGQIAYIGNDLLFHPVDGFRELPDLVPVLDPVFQLFLRRHVFGREPSRLLGDLLQRRKQNMIQIDALYRGHDQRENDHGQYDTLHIGPPRLCHAVHLALHAEDPPDLSLGIFQGDHRRDMRVRFDIALVADHQFPLRFLLVQKPVFRLIVVIRRFPDVAEIVMRIGAVMVDRRKNERDVRVVGQVGLDDIDERGAERVAQPVHRVPCFHVLFRRSSALRVAVHPVRVKDIPRRLRRAERAFRVFRQKRVRKSAVAEQTDDNREYDQHQQDSRNAFEYNTLAWLFHPDTVRFISRRFYTALTHCIRFACGLPRLIVR